MRVTKPTIVGPNPVWLQWGSDEQVPAGGELYLEGPVSLRCSDVGHDVVCDSALCGISFRADAEDGVQTYDIEVIQDPDGTPIVLGTLPIPLSTKSARLVNFDAEIPCGSSLGVRIKRTSGSVASVFTKFTVLVWLTIN